MKQNKINTFISKLEKEVNTAEKSRFGRTVDDIVSLGIGVIPGVITGIIGAEEYTISGAIIGNRGYDYFSKTNRYGSIRNASYTAAGFVYGYVLGSTIKHSLG